MGWLPDGFGEQRMNLRISRAAEVVHCRAEDRRKINRYARWTGTALFVVVLAFVLAPRVDHQAPKRTTDSSLAAHAETLPHGTQVAEIPFRVRPSPLAEFPVPRTGAARPKGLAGRQRTSASPQGTAPDIALEKERGAVKLKWEGNPYKEYVIYRCTSPRFDRCDVAGIVKGTQWTDPEAGSAPLVFYRVEPKSGA